ncbi:Amino acid transporter [Fasciolopsis buskii]|uniref:Amino acid transporter n=1 Tax=Fasciolopsis buskii TaxID=27845 RepID=A0A8E0S1H6_9TREM|nr:Amino acid transporter [Fasciolopsis buski]
MEHADAERATGLLEGPSEAKTKTSKKPARKITYADERRPQIGRMQKIKEWFRNIDNIFVVLTVAAVILGMTIGLLIKIHVDPSPRTIYLVSFPGELLMNMLKMLIIPLIVSSLVAGLAGLDPKSSGKIGMYALIYYVVTTALAVVLGIALVLTIRPGNANIKQAMGEGTIAVRRPETLDSLLDLMRNLFPENIVQACLQQQQSEFVTVHKRPKYVKLDNLSRINEETNLITTTMAAIEMNESRNETVASPVQSAELENYEAVRPKYVDSTNVLGLVSFSIMFGLVLGQMGDKAIVMVQFFAILNEVVMRMVQIIMLYSPFGIFFLILGKMLEIDNLKDTATSLGLYMTTVVTGLAIHSLGTLALLYFAVTRKNPYKFYKGIFQAWITALGTASSAATLPITFRCLENNLNIDKRVTRFVLPIGATINMDGTALYEAVASIFIAQINAKNLSVIEVFIVSLTATLAAIGAASVPSAGLVTMMLVLTSVGLPTKDISLILAVDWLLDRIRTSINVLGDAVGAGVVDHLCRKELAEKDAETERELDEAVEEFNKRMSLPSSPSGMDQAIPTDKRRWSKKRMSVAAAMKLQENASPLTAAIPAAAIIDHGSPSRTQPYTTTEPVEDIDA